MKNYFLFIIIIPLFSLAQFPCNNGSAAGFPCQNFNLQDFLTPSDMDANFANDSWGWTDPQDGKEYALVGLNNGTAFIDISNPSSIVYLGKLPTHNNFIDGGEIWRDIKVYNNHAFIVSEISNHGMQVFDLTRLRNVNNPPVTFTEDAHYDGFGSCHNIVINEATGFAYGVGSDTFGGGPHFVNIQNPTNPSFAGSYPQGGYCHDAQVIIYNGPDPDYQGKEIFFGSNAVEVFIADFTNKNNPQTISNLSYANQSYTHQGWLTEDQRYFILGDEIDEIDFGFNTRTLFFDFEDLDNPVYWFDYFGDTPAIDHNGYVKGNYYYMANYNAGMRVLDISDIANENVTLYGYFDTIPNTNEVGFGGTWNVYPFFESGNIVMSGDEGFTLVTSPELSVNSFEAESKFTLYPNPFSTQFNIKANQSSITSVAIYNILGQEVYQVNNLNTNQFSVETSTFSRGMYIVNINNTYQEKLIKM